MHCHVAARRVTHTMEFEKRCILVRSKRTKYHWRSISFNHLHTSVSRFWCVRVPLSDKVDHFWLTANFHHLAWTDVVGSQFAI